MVFVVYVQYILLVLHSLVIILIEYDILHSFVYEVGIATWISLTRIENDPGLLMLSMISNQKQYRTRKWNKSRINGFFIAYILSKI